MNRDKQIRALLIRNCGSAFKRYEGVIVAGQDDFSPDLRFNKSFQPLGNIQYEFFLRKTGRTDASRIVASVPCINDNPRNL
jgi:hypothetical protein